MELTAKRDFKKLAQLCGEDESTIKAALQHIARLEPKPGRPFVQAERNIIVPDVIVTPVGRGAAGAAYSTEGALSSLTASGSLLPSVPGTA